MPKNNIYLIPKENLPKTEEIRYVNTEIPSYEDFLKNYYKPNEADEALTEAEYQDRLLHGPQYGPGNTQSYNDNSERARRERHACKAMVGAATSVVSKVAGPAGFVINGTVGAVTGIVGEVGKAFSDDDVWKYTSELGQSMVTSAIVGDLIDTGVAPLFEGSSSGLIREGWEMWKEFDERGGKDRLMVDFHGFHQARGESSNRYCDVCNS